MIESSDIKIILCATVIWFIIAISFYIYHKPYKEKKCSISEINFYSYSSNCQRENKP